MRHQIPTDPNSDARFREKVSAIISELCDGLGCVDARFVEEAVYGIAQSGSVRLTAISHVLKEDIPIHATHKRLSRNLGHKAVGEVLLSNLLARGVEQLKDDSLLVLNTMEVEKKYAEKMAFLGEIDNKGQRKGYEMCEILAAGNLSQADRTVETLVDGEKIIADIASQRDFVPVTQTLWSRSAPEFEGVNQQILNLVGQIREQSGSNGIVVCNREQDDRQLLQTWAESAPDRFIVRQQMGSQLQYRNSTKSVEELIESCATPYGATVFAYGNHNPHEENGYFVHFGFIPVRLPEAPDRQLNLVVFKGLDGPIALLTTEPMRRNRAVIQDVLEAYFKAWSVRVTSRFMKQDYQFADVRVLTYDRLKNMAALLSVLTFMDTLWPGGEATVKGVRFERRKGAHDLPVYHIHQRRKNALRKIAEL